VVGVLALGAGEHLEAHLQPRGHRLLHKIPRLPEPVADRIVQRFDGLQKILRASLDELDAVDGVGETRARLVKDGLSRLAEASILDRYA
jgi:diadenylate cyclase